MKKYFVLLSLILFILPLAAREGSMAGSGKLRVSQTKYFDIIYSQKNLATATILYENADAVFEELATAYGIDPYFRLPVVITTSVEQFNAYYSDSPFNRIVIYDTAQIDDLAVFSQTLLSTFTHELTHALTYNLKNKGMRIVGKIFGDAFSAHYITVTSGMAEGATVSYESSKGEGRLNDAYSLQMIRQAKIEGKFPSYSDVKGASDAYPRSAFYYFNGAFAEYLQKNYGMHKYAEFWYRCINIEHLSDISAAGAFKKTYGIKLNKAWKNFEAALYVPQVAGPDPVALGLAEDFFKPGICKLSIKNRAGSLYSNLCSSQTGLAFIDESCDTVYFYSQGKIKKLFTRSFIDSIRLSQDGRFLAVAYYTGASPTIKHCAAIYDIQKDRWISVPGTNYVNPAIITDGLYYYFVAQNYEGQRYSVCVKRLDVNGGKVKIPEEDFVKKYFAEEEVPQSFTDLGNGRLAFILKAGMKYSICLSDIELSEIKEYRPGIEGIKLRDLAAGPDCILFSWASKESLPRPGYLNLSDENFYLAQENLSGGVYTPVEFQGHLYYTGQFYKERRLLELKKGPEFLEEGQKSPVETILSVISLLDNPVITVLDTATSPDNSPAPLPYRSYRPFSYAFEGLLIPIGGLASQNQVPTLGFSYLTSSPWYSGITMLSGGYDLAGKSGIFDFTYQSGTDTNLFQYALASSFTVDKDGFKQISGNARTITAFDFGRISAISFSLQADAKYGRLVQDSKSRYLSTVQLATISYSNVVSSGPGTYERAGIKAAAGLVHCYEKEVQPKSEQLLNLFDVEIDFSAYIPKLIPLTCIDNFTYNLPTKLETFFFSLSSTTMRLARLESQTILFAYDIQKAAPGFSALFFNDILLTLGYTGGFDYASVKEYEENWHFLYTDDYIRQIKNHELLYKDYITLKLLIGFTPNIGSFANPDARFNLCFSFNFGKKESLPVDLFTVGFEAKF